MTDSNAAKATFDLDALEEDANSVMSLVDDQAVVLAAPVLALIAELRASRKVIAELRDADENGLLKYALPAVYDALNALNGG